MPSFGGFVFPTGTEATGRISLREAVGELSRPINADDETVRAMAGDSIRSAIRTMNRKGCWPWEYQIEEVATAINNRYSTVQSAVKKPMSMHRLISSGGLEDYWKVSYIAYDVFREKFTLNYASRPVYYTIPNLFETGQIEWHPVPSQVDLYRFSFWRVTPAPRNENETIEVPDYAFEAYMARAWYEMSKRLPVNQRPMPIQLAAEEAKQAFRELTVHVNLPGDRSRSREPY